MEKSATPQLDEATLSGDIRDFLLTWIRNMQKPFEQMSESDQRDLIDAVEGSARELVGGVISVVSGRGFEKAFVKLGKFSVGDGIEAKLITDRSERNLLNFNDFAGRSAMLIFADPAEFDGARGPARVFKRQRDIEEEIADQKEAEVSDKAVAEKTERMAAAEAKPKKEKKPKAEKPPVKTTDVETSKPFAKPSAVIDGDGKVKRIDTSPGAFGTNRELIDPDTGEVLDASRSNPTRDRSLEDEHRLNENETVDPITGEVIEIKPAATLDDLFSRAAEPEPDAVLVDEAEEVQWTKNPAQQAPTMPDEMPTHLKRVKNPAKPGTIDKDDPGEPETVTVNDDAPVARSRPTSAEPKVDEDFP